MPLTVLSVDDEAIINMTTKRILEQSGYSTVTAVSGEEALQLLENNLQPNIILLDIDLGPGRMDGPQTAEKINKTYRIPIIFYSGHDDKATIEKTKQITKYGYVQKTPKSTEFLLATIEMALKLYDAEIRTLDSEQRYRELFNQIESGVAVFRPVDHGEDFEFIDFNKAAETIDVVKKEEIIGKRLLHVWTGLKESGFFPALQRVWRTGNSEFFNAQYYPGTKLLRWYENFIYRLSSGEIVVLYKEVSRSKRIETEREIYLHQIELHNNILQIFLTLPEDRMYEELLKLLLENFHADDGLFGYVNSEKELVLTEEMKKHKIFSEIQGPSSCIPHNAWRNYWRKAYRNRHIEPADTEITAVAVPVVFQDETIALIILRKQTDRFFDEELSQIKDTSALIAPVLQARLRRIYHEKRELQISEEVKKLATIVESTGDAVFTKDLNGIITSWNHSAERLYGYSADEIIGKHVSILAPSSEHTQIETMMKEIASGKRINHFEARRMTKAGRPVYISLTLSPLYDNEKRIYGISAIARDITSRKKIEKELLKQEELYRTILRESFDGFILTNSEGTIVEWNRAIESITGYPQSSAIGSYIWDILFGLADPERKTPQLKSFLEQSIRECFVTGQAPWLNEIRDQIFFTKNGQKKMVQSLLYTVNTESSRNIGAIIRDVTSLRLREKDLTKSEERYKTLVDAIPESVCVIDYEWRYIYANDSSSYLIGKTITEVFPEIKKTGFFQTASGVMRNRQKASVTDTFTAQGTRELNKERWYEISVYPVTEGILCISRDVTEQKQLLGQLSDSYKKLITILNSINAGIYVADMNTYRILFLNKYGRKKADVMEGQICWKVMQKDQTGPCSFCTNQYLLDEEGNPNDGYEWEFRNTVNNRWYKIYDRAIKWFDERIVRMEISFDITEQKLNEEKLTQTLTEKDFLVKEMHHRVKNNLNMITSLINLSAVSDKNRNTESVFNDLRSRILTIVKLHEQIYQSDAVTSVNIKEYIEDIAKTIFRQFSSFHVTAQFDIELTQLPVARAIPLGIIVNELATNAVKHGFVPGTENHFSVSFKKEHEIYILHVRNTGRPISEKIDPDTADSFGIRLIHILVHQLHGTVSIHRDGGTEFRIQFSDGEPV